MMHHPNPVNLFLHCAGIALLLLTAIPGKTLAQTGKSLVDETASESSLPPTTIPFINTTATLPQHFPVPGGLAIVPLDMRGAKTPVVKFGSRKVLVIPYQDQWQAIVGLPGDILPGNYILGTVNEDEEPAKVPLRVVPLPPPAHNQNDDDPGGIATTFTNRFASPVELEATVASSDYINPSMTIPRELIVDDRNFSPSFIFAPVMESNQFVPYGNILRQNKVVAHYYISYVGKSESQVYAPAPGVVVKVIEDQKYSGQIYISHGGGIVSVLGNLEKILVQEGQVLDRGEQIGRANYDGSLDRSRVDYGLSLNGFLIDPLQFPSTP